MRVLSLQRRWVPLWLAACAALLLALAPSVAAPAPGHRADDIASHTMSPFCPGRTLSSCPSPKAAEWRHDIRQWVDEGLSTEEIRARLEQRVPGQDLSGAPRSPGGWLLPVALLLVSAGVLWAVLRRLRQGRDARPAAPRANDDRSAELDRRLEAELDSLDD